VRQVGYLLELVPLCQSVLLPAGISAALTGRISVKSDTGDFMKICLQPPDMLKSDKNIRHFTCGPKQGLVFPEI
jgi:hypothetical protein